jgi:hypothetical protein
MPASNQIGDLAGSLKWRWDPAPGGASSSNPRRGKREAPLAENLPTSIEINRAQSRLGTAEAYAEDVELLRIDPNRGLIRGFPQATQNLVLRKQRGGSTPPPGTNQFGGLDRASRPF